MRTGSGLQMRSRFGRRRFSGPNAGWLDAAGREAETAANRRDRSDAFRRNVRRPCFRHGDGGSNSPTPSMRLIAPVAGGAGCGAITTIVRSAPPRRNSIAGRGSPTRPPVAPVPCVPRWVIGSAARRGRGTDNLRRALAAGGDAPPSELSRPRFADRLRLGSR